MSATAVRRNLAELAPKFRAAVEAALAECEAAGLDAWVYEAVRTDERQRWLYAQGRTRPGARVTNASSALYGWHFYGLAVDVISRSRSWDAPVDWWHRVAAIFKRHGCDWGGDWEHPDLPHFQFGTLRASPSDRARELYATGGLVAVWKEVGAWEEPADEPDVIPPPLYEPAPAEVVIPPAEPEIVVPAPPAPEPPVLHTITVPEPPEDAHGVSALLWAKHAARVVGFAAASRAREDAAALLPDALSRLRAAVEARAPSWLVGLLWPLVEREARRALEGER